MMFEVNFTSPAENDLVSILQYISEILKSTSAANNLLNKIEEQIKLLEENPHLFLLSTDAYLNRHGIRQLRVKNYLIFHTIDDVLNLVTIIRIMYARRDWTNILKEELD